jgi:hypothetical protein
LAEYCFIFGSLITKSPRTAIIPVKDSHGESSFQTRLILPAAPKDVFSTTFSQLHGSGLNPPFGRRHRESFTAVPSISLTIKKQKTCAKGKILQKFLQASASFADLNCLTSRKAKFVEPGQPAAFQSSTVGHLKNGHSGGTVMTAANAPHHQEPGRD